MGGGNAQSGWIGFLSYELGRWIEPSAHAARTRDEASALPLIELHRVDRFEPLRGWAPALPPLAGAALTQVSSATGQSRFERDAARVVEYIRAGDVFQANLAHHLRGRLTIPPREAFARLLARADPWLGAYIEVASPAAHRPAIASLSPELFLRTDAPDATGARRITTRPMKGTRPASIDPGELERSPKDRAELAMIVDLMRNDLGRVCRFGSVRVDHPRAIETHAGRAGVHQATATISGTLRDGVSFADVLRATFPPGSVTGAPKVRAMQIIDELEPVERGPYCGAIAHILDDGSATLAVAIRTAVITPDAGPSPSWSLNYAVGAGIVADSDPRTEWRETLAKASILDALGAAPADLDALP